MKKASNNYGISALSLTMPSLNVLCKVLLCLKFPATAIDSAVFEYFRHIIY